jgi:hypothetical protein
MNTESKHHHHHHTKRRTSGEYACPKFALQFVSKEIPKQQHTYKQVHQ